MSLGRNGLAGLIRRGTGVTQAQPPGSAPARQAEAGVIGADTKPCHPGRSDVENRNPSQSESLTMVSRSAPLTDPSGMTTRPDKQWLRRPQAFFSIFQKNWTGESTMPVRLLR